MQLNRKLCLCSFVPFAQIVGISPEEQHDVFRTVAAVLHLGNILFVDGSEVESSKISDSNAEFHLSSVASLLGVDVEGLRKSLTTRTRSTFGTPPSETHAQTHSHPMPSHHSHSFSRSCQGFLILIAFSATIPPCAPQTHLFRIPALLRWAYHLAASGGCGAAEPRLSRKDYLQSHV